MGQYSEYGAAAAGVAASGYSDPFGDPRRHSMASMTSGGLAGARQRNSSYGAPTSDQQHYSSFSGHGSNGPEATYSDWHAYTAAYGVGAAHEPSAASHYFDGSGAAYPAAAVPAGESGSSNDHSDPTPVDQRLNPRAVLDRLRQGNHSDLSLNDDANDYSRPLRACRGAEGTPLTASRCREPGVIFRLAEPATFDKAVQLIFVISRCRPMTSNADRGRVRRSRERAG